VFRRALRLAAFTELFERADIASNQRFFLLSTPALQLSFSSNRGCERIKNFRIDKLNGTPSGSVLRGNAFIVSFLTGSQVVGVADVEGIVAATEDVKTKGIGSAPRLTSFARDTIRWWPRSGLP
jgi:hypothetical protein